MYNSKPIDELISFIEENDGIGDKIKMQKLVVERFQLTKDGRSIYVAKEYASHFIYSKFCKKMLDKDETYEEQFYFEKARDHIIGNNTRCQ